MMQTRKLSRIVKPLNKFIQEEYSSGIILLICVVIAIVWANSPWKESYHHLWEVKFSIGYGDHILSNTLHHWINDGLMALFFFVVGLELKREFLAGELSSIKKAAVPIISAVGGMVVPALIYAAINFGKPSIGGWGIPMATDIAFALGILSLAGKKIPLSVKVFLTALAVVDDLGAVLVIAFFYSSDISVINLIQGFVFLFILIISNIIGIRSSIYYAIIGVLGIWLAFLLSGVHATIAGVLAAMTIPARTKINEEKYHKEITKLAKDFQKEIPNNGLLLTPAQHGIIQQIKKVSSDAETPLQKLENSLHPLVAFVVMPLFALSNAGVEISSNFLTSLVQPISLGVGFGLLAGKFIGVSLFSWLPVKLGLSSLPEEMTMRHLIGVSCLAGVGFTMSLFISNLAFNDMEMINEAKYGILLSSIVAGTIGLLILKTNNQGLKLDK